MKKKSKIVIALIAVLLCCLMAVFISACDDQNKNNGGNTQTQQPPANQKLTYDMSGVVFGDLTVPYDGLPHSIEATNLPEGVTATYDGNGQTEIGSYTVTAHFHGDSDKYEPIPDKTAELTITETSLDMSRVSFSDTTVEYDGLPHFIFATEVPEGVSVMYVGNGQMSVGKYVISAYFFDESNNDVPILYKTATLTITKRELKVEFYGDQVIEYDGQVHKDVTATPTNLIGNDTVELTLTYSGDMIETGEYTVTATIAENEKYVLTKDNTYKVTIKISVYTVTFRQDGQKDIIRQVKYKGAVSEEDIPTPVQENGYTIEWEENDLSCITEDIIVNAVKTAIAYRIIYHLDDGTNAEGNPENYTIETSDIILLPATRSGFTFKGWFEESLFNTQVTVIGQGSYGEINLYAKWMRNGTEGLKYELSGEECTITGYNGTSTNIYIPEEWSEHPVTAIGERAFQDCTRLESIKIPDSVTTIGYGAFYACTAEIIWGDNPAITEIANSSFFYYQGTSITIPDSVTTIGSEAFYDCTKLTDITIPDRVTSIGRYAFYACTDLETVYWNATNCTSLTNYSYIFYRCTALTTVIIGDNVQSIPSYAFHNCESLENVKIGNSVTTIGVDAFYNCTAEIIWGDNPKITEISSRAFAYYKGKNLIIPDSVISIGEYAFDTCTAEKIIWGDNPTITEISSRAFAYYKGKNLIIPDSVTAIGSYAFYHCTAEIIWGDNPTITRIGSDTFDYYQGTNLIIPDSVTEIGSSAFSDCTRLESITIPDSITTIGDWAFHNCTSLKKITIPDSVISIGEYAFDNCTNITSVTIGNGVTAIGSSAFGGCTSLERIIIPDRVTSIDESVFYNCTSLTSVTIGNGVTAIGSSAFENCTSLINITIPDNVNTLGENAFYNCISLKSVTIGNSVTEIGKRAFYGCTSLEEVYYVGTAEEWNEISIGVGNSCLTDATRYYYSEEYKEGNYWHWADEAHTTPAIWTKEED